MAGTKLVSFQENVWEMTDPSLFSHNYRELICFFNFPPEASSANFYRALCLNLEHTVQRGQQFSD